MAMVVGSIAPETLLRALAMFEDQVLAAGALRPIERYASDLNIRVRVRVYTLNNKCLTSCYCRGQAVHQAASSLHQIRREGRAPAHCALPACGVVNVTVTGGGIRCG
jgi:hypothetical protein